MVDLEPPNENEPCLGVSVFDPKEKFEVVELVFGVVNEVVTEVEPDVPKLKTLEFGASFLAASPKLNPESAFFSEAPPKLKEGASETVGLAKPPKEGVAEVVLAVATVVDPKAEGRVEDFPKLNVPLVPEAVVVADTMEEKALDDAAEFVVDVVAGVFPNVPNNEGTESVLAFELSPPKLKENEGLIPPSTVEVVDGVTLDVAGAPKVNVELLFIEGRLVAVLVVPPVVELKENDVDGTLTELVVTAPNENPLDPVDFVTSGALLKLIEGVTVATDTVGVVVATATFVPKLKFTEGLGGVNKTSGFPIAADGDVMAVFLNPNASPSKLIGLDTAEAVLSCSGFVVTVVEVGEAI